MRFIPDPLPQTKVQQQKYDSEREVHYHQTNTEDFARPANSLNVHLGEHWGIVSSTGGGKTVFTTRGLLEYLRRQYPEVKRYVLDSTDDPNMENLVHNPLVVVGDDVPDLLKSSTYTQIWKPDHSKIPTRYMQWFERFNDSREPAIIVIDEIASITQRGLQSLETLFKQMRKHDGIVIGESQRMARFSNDIVSQLTHFVQMFINPDPYDLMKAREYLWMSKEEQRPPLNQYGLFYRNTRTRQGYSEYHDFKHFFGSSIH
jgi:hypothetical protein